MTITTRSSSPTDTRSDADLIVLSTHGDERAFRVLFDRHVDVIRGYLINRLGPQIADEVAADTFSVAWSTRAAFRRDVLDARPWLYGIAVNCARRHRSLEERWQRMMRDEAARVEHVDDRDLGAGIVSTAMRVAIGALSVSEREVLLLVALADMNSAQAARVLGISHVAARTRLHRARTKVARQLRDQGVDHA